jgi:CrcB protein
VSAASWAGVALAGGAAAIVRFAVDGAVARRAARSFPFGTLAVNLSGALALGLLAGLGVAGDAYAVAGTATLGSYTTFSTWMYETQRLAEDGDARAALLNLVASLALGLGAVALGRAVGSHL